MDEQQITPQNAARLKKGDDDLHSKVVVYMSQERRRRQEALERIKNGSVYFHQLPEELRDDAEIALAAIRRSGPSWNRTLRGALSARLKNNREFVLAAVKLNGHCLGYAASEELRNARDVVLAAVRQNGNALLFASEELRADREIALEAVRHCGVALKYTSEKLRADREIVLEAVGRSAWVLVLASEELRADREVVLTAVRQAGLALQFASAELRGDREVFLAALDSTEEVSETVDHEIVRHASEELMRDREVVLEVVRRYGTALRYASEELRADRNVVMTAILQNGRALTYATRQLRGDRDIVLAAVEQSGRWLIHASEELHGDREVVLVALNNAESQHFETILRCVPNHLQNDPMVAGAIIRKGGHLWQGSEIMERLKNVLLAVRALPQNVTLHVVDEESLVEFSRQWETSILHKVWLGSQLEPPGMPGIGRLFVELSGLPSELRQANELHHCAPVIGATLSLSRDWRDLDSYPAYEPDSDDDEVW